MHHGVDASRMFSNVFGRFLDVFGCFRTFFGRFSDVFGRFSDVFGRFRTFPGLFRPFSDAFRTFSDAFWTFSNAFGRFPDVFGRTRIDRTRKKELKKFCARSAQNFFRPIRFDRPDENEAFGRWARRRPSTKRHRR